MDELSEDLRLLAGPWQRQHGWQIAVATPHPRLFKLRLAFRALLRR